VLKDTVAPKPPMCLHARSVVLRRWKNNKDLVIVAPPPPHFTAVMNTLHMSPK
jgi:hypothetical protein